MTIIALDALTYPWLLGPLDVFIPQTGQMLQFNCMLFGYRPRLWPFGGFFLGVHTPSSLDGYLLENPNLKWMITGWVSLGNLWILTGSGRILMTKRSIRNPQRTVKTWNQWNPENKKREKSREKIGKPCNKCCVICHHCSHFFVGGCSHSLFRVCSSAPDIWWIRGSPYDTSVILCLSFMNSNKMAIS